MFSNHKADVLVVGAGPVGLMSALMLHQRGIATEVIDPENTLESRNYALTLHPSALELLDDVGLATELLDQGVRIDRVAWWDRTGPRATLKLSELPTRFPFLLVLPRMALEHAIERRLIERKVPVRRSHRLSEIATADGRLDCAIEQIGVDSGGYGVAEPMFVVEKVKRTYPRYVIGADGFHSLVRRRTNIGQVSAGEAQGYAPTEFTSDFDLDGELRIVLEQGTSAMMFPLPGGQLRFTAQLHGAAIPQADAPYLPLGTRLFPRLDDDEFEHLMRDRAPWYSSKTTEVTWAGRVRFEPALAARFGAGNVWLAGDAAHVTSPVGVQSLNAGLTEARDLASALARVLSGEPVSVLERYDAEHRAEWRRLLGLEGEPVAKHGADAWIAQNARRLVATLPGTGAHLAALAQQVGLELPALKG